MGRDISRYELVCSHCKNEGIIETTSDDWCRWDVTKMSGFRGRVYFSGPVAEVLTCEKCEKIGSADIICLGDPRFQGS